MNTSHSLTAVCAFGLEKLVCRELQALGFDSSVEQPGRVAFVGTVEAICRANLCLRTADRILIRVAEFDAPDFDALFEQTRAIPWGELVPRDAEFPVNGRSIRSGLSSVPACQRAIKRAVVDAMSRDHGVSTFDEVGPLFRIDFTILKDVARLSIDTTGMGLNRRGYHREKSRPQMKETLAAALVMLSYWKSGRPLIDPICGGGTIAIEAARLARNIAPGIDREFACQSWPSISDEIWGDLRQQARDGETESLSPRILACDTNHHSLRSARDAAEAARVSNDIHFETKTIDEISSQRRFGCVIVSPPESRDGNWDRSQQEVFHLLPHLFRRLPTWSHYILTSFAKCEDVVGRKADRRRKLYIGRQPATYYQFHGPKPVTNEPAEKDRDQRRDAEQVVEGEKDPDASAGGQVASQLTPKEPAPQYEHASGAAAFGQLGAKAQEQSQLFAARLRKRAKHLRRWPTRRGITCYRLYERDVPEIPLVVDVYEDSLHITEFERPHERSPAEHANWLDLMAETAGETLQVPPRKIHLKQRGRQKGKTQHTKMAETGSRMVVHEGGLKLLVNLVDYVDTGLFLDHRVTRQMVRDEAKDKSFLNLFAYTGSFTVYAASGGAKRSVTVDLSKNYLDWAQDNMKLNRLAGEQHRFVASDIMTFLDEHPRGEAYDLVVVDPPTFSNSKRTEQDWDVQDGAVKLLNKLMPLVRTGGVIYFSTNFRRFKFDVEAVNANQVHEISKQTVPEDFRNRRIHRCWRIVK